jgi:hypothetical protein
MPQKMARAGGYSRLRALILASVVEASANNFMAVLATSLYRADVVMVGCTLNIHRATVTSLSWVGFNESKCFYRQQVLYHARR